VRDGGTSRFCVRPGPLNLFFGAGGRVVLVLYVPRHHDHETSLRDHYYSPSASLPRSQETKTTGSRERQSESPPSPRTRRERSETAPGFDRCHLGSPPQQTSFAYTLSSENYSRVVLDPPVTSMCPDCHSRFFFFRSSLWFDDVSGVSR
jgi:hypothetical protein